MNKPCINYPCKWIYKLFGTDEESIRQAVIKVMAKKEYHLDSSRKSSGGKYVSVHLETDVSSEEERNKIYTSLNNDKAVIRIL
jgi:putative lipoic acid-binding regulatory protein